MEFTEFIETIVRSLAIGSVYVLIGLGYNTVYAPTNVFNFAQGEFFMFGGVLAFTLWVTVALPLPFVIVLVLAAAALLGYFEELVAVKPIGYRTGTIGWMLTCMGFAWIFHNFAQSYWGTAPLKFPSFPGVAIEPMNLLGFSVVPQYLLMIVAALVVALTLEQFYARTLIGKAMMATSEDRNAASLRGINVARISGLAFAIGCALTALGGLIMAPITFAYVNAGNAGMMKGFIAVAVGGVGNNRGCLIGGFLLGLLEIFGTRFVPVDYRDSIALGFLLLVLLVRPMGIFGRPSLRRV
ncbi:MAG: branched-chain amino acid ABC transporter permease [Dehalococcoidia bacterium]|nr:branched-chain amino acid ABC transporter permease [Dehalococcoidia bacterium]